MYVYKKVCRTAKIGKFWQGTRRILW